MHLLITPHVLESERCTQGRGDMVCNGRRAKCHHNRSHPAYTPTQSAQREWMAGRIARVRAACGCTCQRHSCRAAMKADATWPVTAALRGRHPSPTASGLARATHRTARRGAVCDVSGRSDEWSLTSRSSSPVSSDAFGLMGPRPREGFLHTNCSSVCRARHHPTTVERVPRGIMRSGEASKNTRLAKIN